MNKFKSFMEKLKKNILFYLVVWLMMVILLVAPITYTKTNADLNGTSVLQEMTDNFVDNLIKLPITEMFSEPYVGDFLGGIKLFSIAYLIIMFIAIYKSLPKTEYDKKEHGSSDWCKNGEQYRVLSKKEGLLLAKDHYLPLNKTGNVNVLIVGRFWFR